MPTPLVFIATPATFDELVLSPRDELVVVDFWGPDCPNCEIFAADEPKLLAELEGVRARIVKVNAYEHHELARRYGVYGIPTFMLFRDGVLLGKMSQYHSRAYWLAVVREKAPAA